MSPRTALLSLTKSGGKRLCLSLLHVVTSELSRPRHVAVGDGVRDRGVRREAVLPHREVGERRLVDFAVQELKDLRRKHGFDDTDDHLERAASGGSHQVGVERSGAANVFHRVEEDRA